MDMILSFILALSLSTLALPALIRHAGAWRLMDVPDARKCHVGLIPRVGGIAIALSTLLSALIWSIGDGPLIGFLIGALIIALFGLLDDRSNLDFRSKFGGQLVGALIACGFGVQLRQLPFIPAEFLPPVILFAATLVFLLATTNAFNLLDGLDGLAAGCGSLSLAAIAALALISAEDAGIMVVAAAALGATLGFLRYNTHPAIVYMGDAGSQFLGFSIGVLSLLLVERSNGALSVAVILPILGLPVIDTAMVMVLRLRSGKSPFAPDRNHIHHKLLSIGLKHHQAVAAIYMVQAAAVSSAILLRHQSDVVILGVYGAICGAAVAGYLLLRHLRHAAVAQPPSDVAGTEQPVAPRGRWVGRLRRNLIRYIECSVVLYLIGGAMTIDAVAADVSIIALCCAGIAASYIVWPQLTMPMVRLATYLAVIYMSYLSANALADSWLRSTPFYAWLISVALAVGLVMALTPRNRFELSTQDLLAILVVLGIVILSVMSTDTSLVASIAVRALIIAYACELLINLRATQVRRMGLVAILSLLAIASLHVAPSADEVMRTLSILPA